MIFNSISFSSRNKEQPSPVFSLTKYGSDDRDEYNTCKSVMTIQLAAEDGQSDDDHYNKSANYGNDKIPTT